VEEGLTARGTAKTRKGLLEKQKRKGLGTIPPVWRAGRQKGEGKNFERTGGKKQGGGSFCGKCGEGLQDDSWLTEGTPSDRRRRRFRKGGGGNNQSGKKKKGPGEGRLSHGRRELLRGEKEGEDTARERS